MFNKKGITFIETMIALLVLGFMLIPVFGYLTGAVQDTEKVYTEAIALSKAKFIMDCMMNQIPFKVIKENKPGELYCRFTANVENLKQPEKDPNGLIRTDRELVRANKRYNNRLSEIAEGNQFLSDIIQDMFGQDCVPVNKSWPGEGHYTDPKGFVYHCIANVRNVVGEDVDQVHENDIFMENEKNNKYKICDITTKDTDGDINLLKKIIVQVTWVPRKGIKDPENYPKQAKSIFLVGFKSNLD